MTDPALIPNPKNYSNADTAKRIVADRGLKFPRPTISAGGLTFRWPVGTEGFEVNGSALLGLHRYIGDNKTDAHVVNFDDRRITVTGTLPGLTSPDNMVNLIDVLTSRNKKVLSLPGILPKQQYVVVENYSFSHTEDDRTSSIGYNITFVRVGIGSNASTSVAKYVVDSIAGVKDSSPSQEQRGSTSQSAKTFVTVDGIDTFKTIAGVVYGNVDLWPVLMDLNTDKISINNPGMIVNRFEMAYHKWPPGTRIAY